MNLAGKLTLMIQTCEQFSDLWEPHLRLLDKNWPQRPVRTLLVTDCATSAHFPGVETLCTGAGAHIPARLTAALPQVQTEYILLTLDDYYPIYPLSTEKLQRLVEIMDTENLDYIRLFSDPPSHHPMKNYRNLYEIDLSENYAVNLYPGIWRKSFLQKTLSFSGDIWAYEVSLTYTARQENARCALSKGKEFPILDVVRKGKLLHRASRYLRRKTAYCGSREVISWREELRIFCFSTGKKILPRNVADWVKDRLRSRGFRFYSDQYEALHDGTAAL